MSGECQRVIITNVRVFSDGKLSAPRAVIITEDGLIGAEEDHSEDTDETVIKVDGNNGVLLPGLIDAHIHLQRTGNLHALARHGVTTALDMACWPADKVASLRKDATRGTADIRSAGLPATAAGTVHSKLLPLPPESYLPGNDSATSLSGDEAAAWVQKRLDEGSDYIKLIADVPGPSQTTLEALTTAAHARGALVVAHTAADVPFRMALSAGADILTHVPHDQAVDGALAERMAHEGRVAVPTLTMSQALSHGVSISSMLWLMITRPSLLFAFIRQARSNPHPRQADQYAVAKSSVTAMYKAGVPVLAGTDCHEEPGSPVDIKHGESIHRELELLVEAGLSTADALRAATSLPAEHFRLSDRGVIEAGKRADLLLIRDDPLVDIRASRSIERVWCGGVEVNLEG